MKFPKLFKQRVTSGFGAGGEKTRMLSLPQIAQPGQQVQVKDIADSSTYWFSALQPVKPWAPSDYRPRQFAFPPGANIIWQPKADEGSAISFQTLRLLADSWDILRIVIETRKDQIAHAPWMIRVKPKPGEKIAEQKKRNREDKDVQKLTDFFKKPDGIHPYSKWVRLWLEDMFVIDAVGLYLQRDKQGRIATAHPLDGATINRVLTDQGFTPPPPSPAYQQIVYGGIACNFTTDDLIYNMRCERTCKRYGYSRVEQILMSVNLGLRRLEWLLQYYTSGNTPEALVFLPADLSIDRIKEAQNWFDSLLSGQTAERRKIRFLPGYGTGDTAKPNIVFPKEPLLKDALDEWLARIVCAQFSVSPQMFERMMTRATAQVGQDVSEEEGVGPDLDEVAAVNNMIIDKLGFGETHEFTYQPARQADALKQMQVDVGYVPKIKTINEVREENGQDPRPEPECDLIGIFGPTGFIPITTPPQPAGMPGEGGGPEGPSGGFGPGKGNGVQGKLPPGDEKKRLQAGSPTEERATEAPSERKQEDITRIKVMKLLGGNGHDSSASIEYAKSAGEEREETAPVSDRTDRTEGGGTTQVADLAAGLSTPPSLDKRRPSLPAGGFTAEGRKAKDILKSVLARSLRNMAHIASRVARKHYSINKIELLLTRIDIVGENTVADIAEHLQKVDAADDLVNKIMSDIDEEFKDLPETAREALKIAALDAIAREAATINIDNVGLISDANKAAELWASQHAAEMVGMKWINGQLVPNPNALYAISDTVREELRKIITKAFTELTPMESLIAKIQNAATFSEYRAEMVARTEVSRAQTQGVVSMWKASGLIKTYDWLTSQNDNVCDICRDMEDGGPYIFGKGPLPAFDSHPNCQCVIVANQITNPDTLLRVTKIHRPHKVRAGAKWRVIDDDGKVYGTHATEHEADAQVAALYANKVEKGDYPGHPFRGNQWTDGEGGGETETSSGKEGKAEEAPAGRGKQIDVSGFPENAKDITEEQRMSQAKLSDIHATMDKDLSEISTGRASFTEVSGKLTAESAGTIVANAKQELSNYTNYLAGDATARTRDYIDRMGTIMADPSLRDIDAAQLDAMMRDSIQKLVYQEIESNRQQFTDHGIRHLTGNAERADEIMLKMSDGTVPAIDRLAQQFIMLNHDVGYTTPLVRAGGMRGIEVSGDHLKMSASIAEEQRSMWNEGKIFSSEQYDRIVGTIGSHDTNKIDFDGDPLGTATRIADNLSLFNDEKLPSMFRYVEGGELLLTQMGRYSAKKDFKGFDTVRAQLHDRIDKSNMSPALKRDLKAAVREMNYMTPKFTLGVLSGSISSIKKTDGKLDVEIKHDWFESVLQKQFNMGQKQAAKFLKTYGITDFSKTEYAVGDRMTLRVTGIKGKKVEKGDVVGHPFHGNQYTDEGYNPFLTGSPHRMVLLQAGFDKTRDDEFYEEYQRGTDTITINTHSREWEHRQRTLIGEDDVVAQGNNWDDLEEHLAEIEKVEKGDEPGHPFRGNQYTDSVIAPPGTAINPPPVTSVDDKGGIERPASTDEVRDFLNHYYPPDKTEWVEQGSWQYRSSVSLDDIDMKQRPGGHDPKKVAIIAERIKRGEQMRPIVLVDTGKGKLVIGDGYHRVMGMQAAGQDSLSAFVGSGMGEHGPWDAEIHEAKLNVGDKRGDWSQKLDGIELVEWSDWQFFSKVETAGITTQTNVNFEPPPETTDRKKKEVRFAKDGIGADDRPAPAFVREMTPDEFLNAIPQSSEDVMMERAIRDGATVAPLALDVRWLADRQSWQVTGHDGGKRAAAIRNIDPETTIPVRMYVND